ncbi:hypothetical protein I302_103235 [Kwoniella bestiolae CBS 10118]|uniref:Uncharacterized protein n=1 Tax=Kwoniella bestiolae CBS 10118 TaxID=1296100 RepID=A0A1B9G7U9_9TREE|nr:hypothetical protein I302_01934 [Kwoniella bestiolae CBS 10118]OCF27099.1 hypothetical protein I302_01934 [Kwoniella bestiolae CBS 10118]
MSDDLHPDLDEFYDTVHGSDDQWVDEDDDEGNVQVFIDPDDFFGSEDEDEDDDDADYIFEEDIGEIYDEDDEEEEGESDEDMGDARLIIDNEDDGSAEAFRELHNVITRNQVAEFEDEEGNMDVRRILQTLLRGGGLRTTTGRTSANALNGLARAQAQEQRRNRRDDPKWKAPKEPQAAGVELLRSGEFGRVGQWSPPGKEGRKRPKVHNGWMKGWSGPKNTSPHSHAIVPNTPGTIVAAYPAVPYVGQFAREDYSLFYTATQFFTLHLYSMNESRKNRISHRPNPNKRQRTSRSPEVVTSPSAQEEEEEEEDEDDYETEESDDEVFDPWGRRGRAVSEDSSLKKIKRVQGVEGSWTVTDCDADRKGEKMIYSSITPYVHMLYTAESDQEHVELNFSTTRRNDSWGYDRFGIWSIRFSADGKEVVAGASGGKIMVYDIDAQRRTLAVSGHQDDVNAVSFADESSTNILVSGSDDGYVKVWDRRSLSSSTPSGILVGATEGITYTSPKGDGRYIIANSKDQAARLYDLRKMRSANEFEGEKDAVIHYGQQRFDYRNMEYPRPNRLAHPKDCSIMTFRGHSVLRTLIRCHFSPRESTGQSYIYSGSADGLIHIWSLDGRVLNRAEALPLKQQNTYTDPATSDPTLPAGSRRNTAQSYSSYGMGFTVRDVAWHGYEPTLMSTCWETRGRERHGGNIAKHEWKGLGKGGLRRLEDWVEKRQEEEAERTMPGGMGWSDWDM